MPFIIAFTVSVLFNFFVILFGKKDIETLKAQIAKGDSYLKQINEAMIEMLGDKGATVLKLILAIFAILFLIWHLLTAIGVLISIFAGTWAAKKAYKIPAVSSVLNKIATYVNRLRQP